MILVTGGAGFIGLNFIHYLQNIVLTHQLLIVDKLTYASHGLELIKLKNIKIEVLDIGNKQYLESIFKKYPIHTVINFAAESHVDNSIKNLVPFVESNIVGTLNLLQLSVQYNVKKFIQVSTDEVFGEILEGSFNEESPINPRNPYSASKASAETFIRAFNNTYGLGAIIVNCSNNFGPFQHTEKLIPLAITHLLEGRKVPIYGDGTQVRDWLYVDDCVRAIYKVYMEGRPGERYCIGGGTEIKNVDLVKMIIKEMNMREDMIEYVADRPGHDYRYSTDSSKIQSELGWKQKWSLEEGIRETIKWIKENEGRV
jgi:dTDP-glucose 4,6-dehydratase